MLASTGAAAAILPPEAGATYIQTYVRIHTRTHTSRLMQLRRTLPDSDVCGRMQEQLAQRLESERKREENKERQRLEKERQRALIEMQVVII